MKSVRKFDAMEPHHRLAQVEKLPSVCTPADVEANHTAVAAGVCAASLRGAGGAGILPGNSVPVESSCPVPLGQRRLQQEDTPSLQEPREVRPPGELLHEEQQRHELQHPRFELRQLPQQQPRQQQQRPQQSWGNPTACRVPLHRLRRVSEFAVRDASANLRQGEQHNPPRRRPVPRLDKAHEQRLLLQQAQQDEKSERKSSPKPFSTSPNVGPSQPEPKFPPQVQHEPESPPQAQHEPESPPQAQRKSEWPPQQQHEPESPPQPQREPQSPPLTQHKPKSGPEPLPQTQHEPESPLQLQHQPLSPPQLRPQPNMLPPPTWHLQGPPPQCGQHAVQQLQQTPQRENGLAYQVCALRPSFVGPASVVESAMESSRGPHQSVLEKGMTVRLASKRRYTLASVASAIAPRLARGLGQLQRSLSVLPGAARRRAIEQLSPSLRVALLEYVEQGAVQTVQCNRAVEHEEGVVQSLPAAAVGVDASARKRKMSPEGAARPGRTAMGGVCTVRSGNEVRYFARITVGGIAAHSRSTCCLSMALHLRSLLESLFKARRPEKCSLEQWLLTVFSPASASTCHSASSCRAEPAGRAADLADALQSIWRETWSFRVIVDLRSDVGQMVSTRCVCSVAEALRLQRRFEAARAVGGWPALRRALAAHLPTRSTYGKNAMASADHVSPIERKLALLDARHQEKTLERARLADRQRQRRAALAEARVGRAEKVIMRLTTSLDQLLKSATCVGPLRPAASFAVKRGKSIACKKRTVARRAQGAIGCRRHYRLKDGGHDIASGGSGLQSVSGVSSQGEAGFMLQGGWLGGDRRPAGRRRRLMQVNGSPNGVPLMRGAKNALDMRPPEPGPQGGA